MMIKNDISYHFLYRSFHDLNGDFKFLFLFISLYGLKNWNLIYFYISYITFKLFDMSGIFNKTLYDTAFIQRTMTSVEPIFYEKYNIQSTSKFPIKSETIESKLDKLELENDSIKNKNIELESEIKSLMNINIEILKKLDIINQNITSGITIKEPIPIFGKKRKPSKKAT